MSVHAPPLLRPSGSRYTIFGQLGAGGMASVQYAQLVGPSGFSRPVAIKRLHPHLAKDPVFAALFLEEARLSARIAHANVVATLDVVSEPDEIAVVMEYIHGESLAGLLRMARARATPLPHKVAANLVVGVLHGLQAAHETRSEHGEPLGIVHRDVSPENILVGSDGIARLLDFGIAKATGRTRTTPSGELKGKLGYMAPEQYDGSEVDRRVDIYGASVVLWEALAGRTLFAGPTDAAVVHAVMSTRVPAPSTLISGIPPQLDRLVLQGLSRDREQRFRSARQMALALEQEVGLATQSEVTEWLQDLAGELLEERAQHLAQLRREAEPSSEQAGTRRVQSSAVAASARPGPPPAHVPARTRANGSRLAALARTLGLLLVIVLCGAWLASEHQARPSPSPLPAPPAPPQHTARTEPEPAARAPALEAEPEPAARPAETFPAPPSLEAADRPARTAPLAARKERRGKTTKPHDDVQETPETAPTLAPAAPARVDCSEPYEVDTLGIRRWKPECL